MSSETSLRTSHFVLTLNTLAFTICFACWTLNGVLVTYLVDNGIFNWSVVETGWLLGLPILSGSIFRPLMGMLTDKYGGKPVFSTLLIFCAIPFFLMYFVNSYWMYFILSILFGMVGTGFAVGVAFTSVWYPKNWQGRALGIFGMGNAGATLLKWLTDNNENLEGWRWLPIIYGIVILVMGLAFLLFTKNKKAAQAPKSVHQMLTPLKSTRGWRFGLYYFLVFGLFVAFSQWLLPYYINVYSTSLILGGMLASAFSLPSGVIRALGGYLSDKFGARAVMHWVLLSSLVIGGLLMLPKMEILTPGKGVASPKNTTVEKVENNSITLQGVDKPFVLKEKPEIRDENNIFPKSYSWQEALVKDNQAVKKKEVIAQGVTLIKFEAHIWVYTILVILIGIMWGIGKAAVYKYIPEYFPNEVGIVGGMVGLIGGLGGFIGPILFGYLLDFSGLWTSSWIFVFLTSAACLYWMHRTINKLNKKAAPELQDKIE